MSRKFLTPLVLPADPTAALEAATKQYVDSKVGSDDVWIGPSDPIATVPTAELWYDTDADVPPNVSVTSWTGVTFSNNWVNFGGTEQNVQYRKEGDVVRLRGVMKSGTLGAVAFNLPVGFRPPANMSCLQEGATTAASGVVALSVSANGDVMPQTAWGATGGYVRTNLSFSVTA